MVLTIKPDKFVHFLYKLLMWNSKEQFQYMKILRSKTLFEGFIYKYLVIFNFE